MLDFKYLKSRQQIFIEENSLWRAEILGHPNKKTVGGGEMRSYIAVGTQKVGHHPREEVRGH